MSGDGLCQCGCGIKTTVATQNDPKAGILKGEHRRFRPGHFHRGRKRSAETKAKMSEAARGKITGARHARWNGGVQVCRGRRLILVGPDHPMATKSGYVLEYRLVLAAALGRYLDTSEHVHHVNGDPLDNRPENLIVLSAAEHMRVHRLIDRRGLLPIEALVEALA